ncbi:MAG: TylF/MycF/NovP-related O-methyltransferase [Planctomycetota bacterium]
MRKLRLAAQYACGFLRRRRLLSSLSDSELSLIRTVQRRKLTYLSQEKLARLITVCQDIEKREIPGDFIETGCALGGSTIVIAKSKADQRPLRVYDVFGQIPAPGDRDPPDVHERFNTIRTGKSAGISGDQYYGYRDDLYEAVQDNLLSFELDINSQQISLIKGVIEQTLVVDTPVAMAHVDVDWFDPVSISLQRIFPRLSVGGEIILDDYHYWGGCRAAVDEYLLTVPGEFTLDTLGDSVRLIRTA